MLCSMFAHRRAGCNELLQHGHQLLSVITTPISPGGAEDLDSTQTSEGGPRVATAFLTHQEPKTMLRRMLNNSPSQLTQALEYQASICGGQV